MRLLARPESVQEARRFVGDCLDGWGGDGRADVAVLLTSEVVTNAVLHGGPHGPGAEVSLKVHLSPRRARVEVSDTGGGIPTTGDGNLDGLSGRGLLIVEAMASVWGVRANGVGRMGKTVWFEVDSMPPT